VHARVARHAGRDEAGGRGGHARPGPRPGQRGLRSRERRGGKVRTAMRREEDAMSFTRRAFVKTLGVGASLLAARRASAFGLGPADAEAAGAGAGAQPPRPLLLHNNENPLGPGQAALDALRTELGQGAPAGRYIYGRIGELHQAIAQKFGCQPENVVSGCGSTQILREAVQLFTSPTRPLVAGELTYEECAGYAELIGTPVRTIPLARNLQL